MKLILIIIRTYIRAPRNLKMRALRIIIYFAFFFFFLSFFLLVISESKSVIEGGAVERGKRDGRLQYYAPSRRVICAFAILQYIHADQPAREDLRMQRAEEIQRASSHDKISLAPRRLSYIFRGRASLCLLYMVLYGISVWYM